MSVYNLILKFKIYFNSIHQSTWSTWLATS